MHSPPVQPTSSSSSGTGSVRTMWEEATESRLCSGPPARLGGGANREHGALRPHDAPGGMRLDARSRPGDRLTGERSQTSTPRARNRSRNPSASRAGCTVAAFG